MFALWRKVCLKMRRLTYTLLRAHCGNWNGGNGETRGGSGRSMFPWCIVLWPDRLEWREVARFVATAAPVYPGCICVCSHPYHGNCAIFSCESLSSHQYWAAVCACAFRSEEAKRNAAIVATKLLQLHSGKYSAVSKWTSIAFHWLVYQFAEQTVLH